jgi:predicted transcriptional regulator
MEVLAMQQMTNDPYREIGMDQPQYNPTIPPPRASDPLALAGVTVQAVDQIGESASHEIEEAAAAVELAAGEIGTKLRKLAAAVREHSKIAGEQVADFVDRSTNVIETIRALQERLDAGEPKKGNGGDV